MSAAGDAGSAADHRALARTWFAKQQEKMRAELAEVRAVHEHPTAKGDGTELHWLDMLKGRLPARYQAARAFVIDADGGRSEQMDIVIHDRQYCPCLLDTAGGLHIPAESVYAVLEVKQDLTKGNVEYAGGKIASVRRLRRTSAEYTHAGGRGRTAPKPILGGLVTFESGWSPAFGASFDRVLASLSPDERVDIGCALIDGGFDVDYDAAGAPSVVTSTAESSLIFFLLRLLQRLQEVGTVPGIDYDAYTATLVDKGAARDATCD